MATRWNEITQLISQTRLIAGSSLASASGKFEGDGTSANLRFELEFLDGADVLIQSFAGATVAPGAGVTLESKVEGVLVPVGAVKVRGVAVDLDDLGNPIAREWMLNAGPVVLPYRDPRYAIGRDGADAVDDGTARRVTTHEEADQATSPSQNLLGPDAGPELSRTFNYSYIGTVDIAGEPLTDLALAPGHVISFGLDVNAPDENPGPFLEYYDAGGIKIGQDFASAAGTGAYQRLAIEGAVIPPLTAFIVAGTANVQQASGPVLIRRAMLNRGPVALAFEEPPFRVERETLEDANGPLADGTGIRDGLVTSRLYRHHEEITVPGTADTGDPSDPDGVVHVDFGASYEDIPAIALRGHSCVSFSSSLGASASQRLRLQAANASPSGFDSIAQIVNPGATMQKNDDFTSGNALNAVGETAVASLNPAGANDNRYTVHFFVEIQADQADPLTLNQPEVTIAIDTDGGGGFDERATHIYAGFAEDTGPNTETRPHEQRTITVTGLVSGDQIRIRIKSFDPDQGGSFLVRGGDGAGSNIETYNGVTYTTAADSTESAIPADGDFVEWMAQEVT